MSGSEQTRNDFRSPSRACPDSMKHETMVWIGPEGTRRPSPSTPSCPPGTAGARPESDLPGDPNPPAEPHPPADPELARVVEAWPALPEALRRAVVALVEASRGNP